MTLTWKAIFSLLRSREWKSILSRQSLPLLQVICINLQAIRKFIHIMLIELCYDLCKARCV